MNDHEKHADPDYPIHELIVRRWSPYVFDPRPVEPEKLRSCLEAARWAASSFNEQPWVFFVATRDDKTEFSRALSCLAEANQVWAKNAGVLMLTAIATHFSRNDKANRVAEHDLGLAMGNLTVQATELGLSVHQMAGIDIEKTRETYSIPASHNPMTAIAIGYAGDPDKADDQELAKRDRGSRTRKLLSEFVFSGSWQKSASL